MRTRAAVLWGVGKDWQVQDIELDPPSTGEVLVQLTASGLCHSDEHLVTGDLPFQLPIIGGHEGAGVVQEVGPGVTSVKPGDHVVLGFVPSCGRCPSCSTGHQNLCDLGAYLGTGRQISDGTSRHHTPDGEDLSIMCLLGTFSPYTVVNEASCIKVEDDIPLDKACLVGCGLTTGWGSAVYSADVQAGEAVVVIGIGGIGAAAVQGAAMAGARFVVAVDPKEFKREQALALGATHTAASIEEAVGLVGDITWGRKAEKVILTVDVVRGEMIGTIVGALVAKGGRCVVTGLAPALAMDVQLNLADLTLQQKQLVGSIFGGGNPRYDIPRLLRLYMEGKLKIDEMITRTYSLDEVNEGYQAMRDAENVRGVIVY
jgi:S-(hydroxymethyl)glutathione dehydrogenase/alcohol dehydrogenase